MAKFKIDLSSSPTLPFGLFVERPTLLATRWEEIDRFQSRDAAKALHEKIKDLPEYLS